MQQINIYVGPLNRKAWATSCQRAWSFMSKAKSPRQNKTSFGVYNNNLVCDNSLNKQINNTIGIISYLIYLFFDNVLLN